MLSALLRLALAVGIIGYLVRNLDTRALAAILDESLQHWRWMLAGIFFGYLALHVGLVRWKLILDAQGLRMSWRRCFSIYFIGQFFNAFMFGSTGGDLVRALYAAKETHHKKTEAVTTVVIDRVIGLIVLYAMGGVMLAARAPFFLGHWKTHVPALVMLGMIAATAAGLVAVFNPQWFSRWPLAERVKRHPKIVGILQRILVSIHLYRRRTGVLLWTSILSLAIQVVTILQCCCLGRCFQIPLGFVDYLTVLPIIVAVAAIPITPGGLGIREGLAVALFGAMGISSAQSLPLSLLVYFIALGWGLVGGWIFIGYSASSGRTVHEEIVEIEHETAREDREDGIPGAHE